MPPVTRHIPGQADVADGTGCATRPDLVQLQVSTRLPVCHLLICSFAQLVAGHLTLIDAHVGIATGKERPTLFNLVQPESVGCVWCVCIDVQPGNPIAWGPAIRITALPPSSL
ncbi:hypothetical protein J3459_016756 [Metarhizium acridum]|nr:hypothetical protein J3459_016756 [Metarhizium acridum]